MQLFRFTDRGQELGTILVSDLSGVFIEDNYIDLVLAGKEKQIIYGKAKEALEDYAKLTAIWGEMMTAAEAFSTIFISQEDLQ